jgi:two-component system sensor histidine kinase TctE
MAALNETGRSAPTLTRTLLAWLLIPLLVLLALGAYSTYRNASHLAEAERDLVLEEVADDLAESFTSSLRNGGPVQRQSQTIDLILSDARDQRYFAIYNARGGLMAGDSRLLLQGSFHDKEERASFSYISLEGKPLRLAILQGSDEKLPGFHILVAETLVRRDRLALRLSRGVLIPHGAILILVLPLVWFGVRQGLRPLEKLRLSITSRSAQELDDLPVHEAPRELQPVVAALNGLLSRVRAAQEEQRRFTADAAHQIKTPLTALTAEIDLAMSDSSCSCAQPTYRRLQEAAARLTHLVRQLLALAHSEANRGNSHALFDLSELAKEVTGDYLSIAAARHIDLGYEGSEQTIPVQGSAILVSEAMRNLVENALKFTPESGIITVSVQAFPPSFSVADSGPGIPETEWPLIFQRFHRAPESTGIEGSGLGLAIVQEIARNHGAQISVGRSALGGALFTLQFQDQVVSQS